MNSVRVQANAFILLTKPYPCNFQEKLQSKTLTQVADREGLSANHYFSVVTSMIDASLRNRNNFVLLPVIKRRARSSRKKSNIISNKPNLRLSSVPNLHRRWIPVFLPRMVFLFHSLVFYYCNSNMFFRFIKAIYHDFSVPTNYQILRRNEVLVYIR